MSRSGIEYFFAFSEKHNEAKVGSRSTATHSSSALSVFFAVNPHPSAPFLAICPNPRQLKRVLIDTREKNLIILSLILALQAPERPQSKLA